MKSLSDLVNDSEHYAKVISISITELFTVFSPREWLFGIWTNINPLASFLGTRPAYSLLAVWTASNRHTGKVPENNSLPSLVCVPTLYMCSLLWFQIDFSFRDQDREHTTLGTYIPFPCPNKSVCTCSWDSLSQKWFTVFPKSDDMATIYSEPGEISQVSPPPYMYIP